ncbi:unnamed protein product [Closterium sp. NIES-64]|nr:unnamed protein product [Closterium sp. NIES-64]
MLLIKAALPLNPHLPHPHLLSPHFPPPSPPPPPSFTPPSPPFQFLLRHFCNTICPTLPEPEYEMLLIKAATQEEFLPGRLQHNPYSSKQPEYEMLLIKAATQEEFLPRRLQHNPYSSKQVRCAVRLLA